MNRALRVALFTGAYTHIADGVSLTLNRLVAYLLREGHDVRVFAPTVTSPPLSGAGTLFPIPSLAAPGRSDYRLSFGLVQAARRALKAFDPHVVHIATPDILGYGALRWARTRKLPVVATFHTHFASYLPYYGLGRFEPLLWRYLQSFYSTCDLVLVPTPGIKRLLIEKGVNSLVDLWSRGVDAMQFSPAHRSRSFRQGLGPGGTPVILFVGRLVKEKGLETFADVVLRLQGLGVPHRSLVVGDGPLRLHLQNRLPRTHFTGHLTDHALAQAYASADVFFFPSQSETFGNVVLEAAASRLPIVAAESDAFELVVQHGHNGFLAPAGDLKAMTHFVHLLLRDPKCRRQFGEAAHRIACTFDWDAVLEQMATFYDLPRAQRAGSPFYLKEASP